MVRMRDAFVGTGTQGPAGAVVRPENHHGPNEDEALARLAPGEKFSDPDFGPVESSLCSRQAEFDASSVAGRSEVEDGRGERERRVSFFMFCVQ